MGGGGSAELDPASDVRVFSPGEKLELERSGGFAGFASALLGAGAGGVLGTLWPIDDQLTLPFMLAFHRRYRRTGNPAGALREAQLEMLHSADTVRRSPSVWAAFRYVGK